jgi:hypothetical protein
MRAARICSLGAFERQLRSDSSRSRWHRHFFQSLLDLEEGHLPPESTGDHGSFCGSFLRPRPDKYPFNRYVQRARASLYGRDRPLQLRCDEMKGRIGLDQGSEADILFWGPFVVGVFGH